MNTGRISVRYAKALFDLATENGSAKDIYADSIVVSSIIESSSDLNQILHNPVIPISQKEEIIKNLLTNKVNPLLATFINLMVKKRRETYIINALLMYRKIYRQKTGIVRVVVETPVELDEDTKNNILAFVKKKFNKIPELEVKKMPELIGGFIVEVEGLLIDLSVSGQLASIKKVLIHNQRVQ